MRRSSSPCFRLAVTASVAATVIGAIVLASPSATAAGAPTISHASSQLSAAPASAQSATTADAAPALTADEQSASRQAIAAGTGVVVDGQTTETSQVVANPDGTFTLNSHSKAVRVAVDSPTVAHSSPEARVDADGDGWLPVNTTLRLGTDGRIRPAVAATDIAISAGGTDPLVTVTSASAPTSDPSQPGTGSAAGEANVSLTWPTSLPSPTLEGDHATYANVLPGVDLRVTATVDSFTQVLIVKTPEAAANPSLRRLTLGLDTENLALNESPAGGLVGTDASGDVRFTSPVATMWDSSVNPHLGPAPTPSNPGGGDEDPVALDVAATSDPQPDGTVDTAGQLTVTPPATELTSTGSTFPIFIDPGLGGGETKTISEKNDGTSIYNPTDYLRVGNCSWSGCSPYGYVARSFFAYNVSTLRTRNGHPVDVTSAHIYTNQIWNAHGCTPEPVNLYTAHGFTSASVWNDNTAVTNLGSISSNQGGGSGCTAGNLDWSNAAIADRFQAGGAAGATELVFGLVSPKEGDPYGWKKFDNDSSIDVTYTFPPNAPNIVLGNGVSYFVCGGVNYAIDSTPTVSSATTANNEGETLDYTFSYVRSSDDRVMGSTTQTGIPSGKGAVWQPTIPEGTYYFRVSVANHSDHRSGGTVNTSDVVFDFTAPPSPTITSWDYPAGGNYGSPAARSVVGSGPTTSMGSFILSSPGADGFSYAWKKSSAVPSVARQNCGQPSATTNPTTHQPEAGWIPANASGVAVLPVPVDLLADGGVPNLTAKATDDSHNQSGPSSTYTFTMAPANGGNANRVEAESLTPTLDGTWTHGYVSGSTAISSYKESGDNSGGQQQHVTATHAGQTITYTVNVPLDGKYDVQAQTYSNYNAGSFTTSIDGQVLVYGGSDALGREGQPIVTDNWQPSPAKANLGLGGNVVDTSRTPDPDDPTPPPASGNYSKALRLTAGAHTITLTLQPTRSDHTWTDSGGIQRQQDSTTQPPGYVISTDYFRLAWLGN